MEIKNGIDKLARMAQREFEAVRYEINRSGNRVDRLDNKLDKLDNKLDGLNNKVDSNISGLKSETENMKSEMDEKFNLVLNSQDRILKSLENLETDNTMGAGASRRQEDKLENHEERIVLVEEKLGIGEAV